ncbi:MAG: hypothetical protein IT330_17150 [Anaerolineae bacterium]|nr:hypothetical protein [Anaerolineae bacterium]
MTQARPDQKAFIIRNRGTLQAGVLLAILVMPLLLYWAAQANLDAVTGILLGINALLMLAVVSWLA